MKKESVPVRNSLLLLLTATIWGVAFVAQSVSMDYIGGFTFNAVLNIIGAIALLPRMVDLAVQQLHQQPHAGPLRMRHDRRQPLDAGGDRPRIVAVAEPVAREHDHRLRPAVRRRIDRPPHVVA